MKKNILYIFIATAVYEIVIQLVCLFTAKEGFPDNNEHLVWFVIPLSAIAFVAARFVIRDAFVRNFMFLFIIWETINYTFFLGIYSYPKINETSEVIRMIKLITPVFYCLLPFGILYWGTALVLYRRYKKRAEEKSD